MFSFGRLDKRMNITSREWIWDSPGGFVKTLLPYLWSFWAVGVEWGLRICISKKFPGDADWEPHFGSLGLGSLTLLFPLTCFCTLCLWVSGKWCSLNICQCVLPGVAQWIECRPVNQRVAGLIPSQVPSRGHTRDNHTLMFLSLFLPPFPLV